MFMRLTHFLTFLILFSFLSCKKETVLIGDNNPPIVNNIPIVKIENYVNRVFIDLLGREPLDSELETETLALRDANLVKDARQVLIEKLQKSTDFIEGDTSYLHAYHQHLYSLAKGRCLEGASDNDINDVIGGSNDEEVIEKLVMVKKSKSDLQTGVITIEKMFGRMINNAVYDDINMNTFNFVRASFDNLLWRFPTNYEFQAGFNMVDFGTEETLFGQTGTNREDYTEILINSREMFEGMVIWAYRQLLARDPDTVETVAVLDDFYADKDFAKVQLSIMVTDEYAGF
jgi:hypothetical protein